MKEQTTFDKLSAVDVTPHLKQKDRFDYIPHMRCHQLMKKHAPGYAHGVEHAGEWSGPPYFKDDQGESYVIVWVEVDGHRETEVYPVTNHSNRPIKNPSSFDVNSAIKRAFVKCCALHGLGISVFLGEGGRVAELGDWEDPGVEPAPQKKKAPHRKASASPAQQLLAIAVNGIPQRGRGMSVEAYKRRCRAYYDEACIDLKEADAQELYDAIAIEIDASDQP